MSDRILLATVRTFGHVGSALDALPMQARQSSEPVLAVSGHQSCTTVVHRPRLSRPGLSDLDNDFQAPARSSFVKGLAVPGSTLLNAYNRDGSWPLGDRARARRMHHASLRWSVGYAGPCRPAEVRLLLGSPLCGGAGTGDRECAHGSCLSAPQKRRVDLEGHVLRLGLRRRVRLPSPSLKLVSVADSLLLLRFSLSDCFVHRLDSLLSCVYCCPPPGCDEPSTDPTRPTLLSSLSPLPPRGHSTLTTHTRLNTSPSLRNMRTSCSIFSVAALAAVARAGGSIDNSAQAAQLAVRTTPCRLCSSSC